MRVEGWESLLNAHIEDAYRKEFVWGEHDCGLWAAAWVLACTGHDFGADWHGRYTSAAGLKRLIRKRGFADLAAVVTSCLPETPPPSARRGDLVMHEQGALGICTGVHSVYLTDGGALLAFTKDAVLAWAVR